LAILCSVNISPSVYFSSNLIASHLSTCLAISQDKTKVLACYPSKPIITEAAYELLNNDVSNLELILVLIRQKLQKRNK